MGVFRNFTPKRRDITRIVTKHGDHREDLQIDYQERCGYCNDHDKYRFIWFEIDHFVPQSFLKTISATDYKNLVYACRSCNNAKRAKWPTQDEAIHHQNNIGFIDPCDDEYNNQFERDNYGRIVPLTALGGWKYKALKLYKPQHEIIWNLEQLHLLIDEIKAELLNHPDNIILKDRLIATYDKFDKYLDKLFAH